MEQVTVTDKSSKVEEAMVSEKPPCLPCTSNCKLDRAWYRNLANPVINHLPLARQRQLPPCANLIKQICKIPLNSQLKVLYNVMQGFLFGWFAFVLGVFLVVLGVF